MLPRSSIQSGHCPLDSSNNKLPVTGPSPCSSATAVPGLGGPSHLPLLGRSTWPCGSSVHCSSGPAVCSGWS